MMQQQQWLHLRMGSMDINDTVDTVEVAGDMMDILPVEDTPVGADPVEPNTDQL